MIKKNLKNKIFDCTFLLIAIIGIILLVYPFFSDYKLGKSQEIQMRKYMEKVSRMSESEKKRALKDYENQNNNLINSEDPFNKSKNTNIINLSKSKFPEVVAILDIPKIKLKVQVYPTTSRKVLREGIGILEGTPLPVGGKGNHSVLAGHSGLSLKNMFTNLHKLKVGDYFYIDILGEVHAYKVDRIKTVLPNDMSNFEKDPNKDYITLVTCTPIGINSHRLLIRGHRVNNNLDK